MLRLAQRVSGWMVFVIGFYAMAGVTNYPTAPDLELTPGALCQSADEYRYPAKIAYCDRDVSTEAKWAIINTYMKKYNFSVNNTNRTEFKIDHLIPLCMGGANSYTNLWPQHKSVYTLSDPYEVVLCQKLAQGKITQEQAIEKMKYGKMNYQMIPALIKDANKLK